MGIALVTGLLLFSAALIKLLVMAIRLRKIVDVVVPYLRLLFFVFIYFMVFTFFIAYVINNAAHESDITEGYQNYYTCLSGTTFTQIGDCHLSDNVSNFPLVILKGFALSILGLMLFFNFLSWPLIYHWYKLGKALFFDFLVKRRDKDGMTKVMNMMVRESVYTTSSSLKTLGLTVMPTMDEEDEENEEEETTDEEENKNEEEEKQRKKKKKQKEKEEVQESEGDQSSSSSD